MSDDLSRHGSDDSEDESDVDGDGSSENDEGGEIGGNNVGGGFNFNNDQVVI
jgi:hypothetical protein